jgi:hypothetical protein
LSIIADKILQLPAKWLVKEYKPVSISGRTIDPKNIARINIFARLNKRVYIGENLSYNEKSAVLNVMLNANLEIIFTDNFDLNFRTKDTRYDFFLKFNPKEYSIREAVYYLFNLLELPDFDIVETLIGNQGKQSPVPLYGTKLDLQRDTTFTNLYLKEALPIFADIVLFQEQIRNGALEQVELQSRPGFGSIVTIPDNPNPLTKPGTLPGGGTTSPGTGTGGGTTNGGGVGTIDPPPTQTNYIPYLLLGIFIVSKSKKTKTK